MGKRMELRVSHRLNADEALERMKALGDYYRNKHGAGVSWDGAAGRVSTKYLTFHADIDFTVGADAVQLDGPDPGRLLRGRVEKYLTQKLQTYLDPRTPLDRLPRS